MYPIILACRPYGTSRHKQFMRNAFSSNEWWSTFSIRPSAGILYLFLWPHCSLGLWQNITTVAIRRLLRQWSIVVRKWRHIAARRAFPVRAVVVEEDKKVAGTHVQYLMTAERTTHDGLRRIDVLAAFCRRATTSVRVHWYGAMACVVKCDEMVTVEWSWRWCHSMIK